MSSVSISILIPTIGRPSLARTLASIRGLTTNDEVLLLPDGTLPHVTELFSQLNLPGDVLDFGGPYRDWGATLRNRAMPKARGGFLLFMDDDDTYAPGALPLVRASVQQQPERPHLFRMRYPDGRILWDTQQVSVGNLSTQMIVVPNRPDLLGRWSSRYEGDFDFFQSTLALYPDAAVVWHPEIIAHIRH